METTTINPDLIAAFRWHLQTLRAFQLGNRAARALELARVDVAAGKRRYPKSPRQSAPGAPFKGYGTTSMRWCESPADIGLRFVGYADKLALIDHTGWFTDEFQDSSVRGVVYQMPARNGRPVYVSGYNSANYGAADASGPAAIDFGTLWEGEAGVRADRYHYGEHATAAYHADSLAERMAETERAYQAASSAGFAWAEKGEEIAETRGELLQLLAERRAVKGDGAAYPTICATITQTALRMVDQIRELRAEREALASGEGLGRESVHSFWTGEADLRAAFNDGAGKVVL